jgi:ABC-type phosphate transport system substrate-binding protein/tetratricopeptide (TPR) repeat protein
MDKMRKPALMLIALFSAMAVLPLETLKDHHGFLAQESPTPTPTFTAPDSVAEGTTITIDGAESMSVVNQALESGFEGRYAGTNVVTSANGVDQALAAVQSGEIDLAALGRPLTDEELAQGLSEATVSREKIAVIVGRDNPFQGDLTFEQFVQIFRGEITNWAEVGGIDRPIRFVDRPDDSDLRMSLSNYSIFKQAPFQTGANAVQVEEDSTAAVVRELGSDGISYAIASEVVGQNAVRPLSMDGAMPTEPTYPFSQPRGYVYYGEPSVPVEAFLGFATSPEGQQAVSEARQTERANVTAGAEQLPQAITISPDGEYMVRGNEAGQLEWLDAEGNLTDTVAPNAHTGVVTAIAISPDGQTVVSGGADGVIRRWDRNANPIGDPIQAGNGPVMSLAISPDGQTLVSGNANGTIQRWSLADGTSLGAPTQAHEGSVQSISYPPGGQNFITGSSDGNLGFWNADGTPLGKASAHKGGVTNVASTPDGQTIITTGADGTIRQWERATLQPRGDVIAGHNAGITDVAISPDGNTIATAAEDGTLQLWDPNLVPRQPEPLTLESPASSLGFTPDGELVTGLADGQVQVRDAQGEVVSTSGGEAPDQGLDLTGWTSRLQTLPRNIWWLLALIPLLLILAGILGALLGSKRDDDDENDLDTDAEATPTGETTLPGADIRTAEEPGIGLINGPDETDFSIQDADPNLAFVGGEPDFQDDAVLPPEVGMVPPAAAVEEGVSGRNLEQAKLELAEGKRLMQEKRYDLALTHFNQAVELTETERIKAQSSGGRLGGINALSSQALTHQGNALSLMGQAGDAMESYNKALEIDSSAIDAWTGKGRLLTGLGRYEEALFCFDTALEMDESAGIAWLSKGQALIQMGRQAEGQDCLARAAALGVVDVPPFTDQSATFLVSGEYEDPAFQGQVPGYGGVTVPEGYAPDVPLDLQDMVSDLPSEDMILPGANPDGFDVPPGLAADAAKFPSQAETIAFTTAASWQAAMGETTSGPRAGQISPAPTTAEEVIASAHLPNAEDLDELQEALQAPGIAPDDLGEISRTGITEVPDWVINAPVAKVGTAMPNAVPSIPPDTAESFGATADDDISSPGPMGIVTDSATMEGSTATTQSWIKLSIDEHSDRFYAVWHIDSTDRENIKAAGGVELAVRLYDVTGQSSQASLSSPVEQQLCHNDDARDWYLNVPQWDRIYLAEVGYLTESEDWLGIVRSQAVPAVGK